MQIPSLGTIALIVVVSITLSAIPHYFKYQKFKREHIEREKRYRQCLHDGQVGLLIHGLDLFEQQYQEYLKDEQQPAAVEQFSETIADVLALRNLLREAEDV